MPRVLRPAATPTSTARTPPSSDKGGARRHALHGAESFEDGAAQLAPTSAPLQMSPAAGGGPTTEGPREGNPTAAPWGGMIDRGDDPMSPYELVMASPDRDLFMLSGLEETDVLEEQSVSTEDVPHGTSRTASMITTDGRTRHVRSSKVGQHDMDDGRPSNHTLVARTEYYSYDEVEKAARTRLEEHVEDQTLRAERLNATERDLQRRALQLEREYAEKQGQWTDKERVGFEDYYLEVREEILRVQAERKQAQANVTEYNRALESLVGPPEGAEARVKQLSLQIDGQPVDVHGLGVVAAPRVEERSTSSGSRIEPDLLKGSVSAIDEESRSTLNPDGSGSSYSRKDQGSINLLGGVNVERASSTTRTQTTPDGVTTSTSTSNSSKAGWDQKKKAVAVNQSHSTATVDAKGIERQQTTDVNASISGKEIAVGGSHTRTRAGKKLSGEVSFSPQIKASFDVVDKSTGSAERHELHMTIEAMVSGSAGGGAKSGASKGKVSGEVGARVETVHTLAPAELDTWLTDLDETGKGGKPTRVPMLVALTHPGEAAKVVPGLAPHVFGDADVARRGRSGDSVALTMWAGAGVGGSASIGAGGPVGVEMGGGYSEKWLVSKKVTRKAPVTASAGTRIPVEIEIFFSEASEATLQGGLSAGMAKGGASYARAKEQGVGETFELDANHPDYERRFAQFMGIDTREDLRRILDDPDLRTYSVGWKEKRSDETTTGHTAGAGPLEARGKVRTKTEEELAYDRRTGELTGTASGEREESVGFKVGDLYDVESKESMKSEVEVGERGSRATFSIGSADNTTLLDGWKEEKKSALVQVDLVEQEWRILVGRASNVIKWQNCALHTSSDEIAAWERLGKAFRRPDVDLREAALDPQAARELARARALADFITAVNVASAKSIIRNALDHYGYGNDVETGVDLQWTDGKKLWKKEFKDARVEVPPLADKLMDAADAAYRAQEERAPGEPSPVQADEGLRGPAEDWVRLLDTMSWNFLLDRDVKAMNPHVEMVREVLRLKERLTTAVRHYNSAVHGSSLEDNRGWTDEEIAKGEMVHYETAFEDFREREDKAHEEIHDVLENGGFFSTGASRYYDAVERYHELERWIGNWRKMFEDYLKIRQRRYTNMAKHFANRDHQYRKHGPDDERLDALWQTIESYGKYDPEGD